jgi:tetratricopeptide (TPR) repeat protein
VRRAILAALALLPCAAQAGDADIYANCLRLAREVPNIAIQQADAWRGKGGGAPAVHCQATALITLKQYEDAALKLESLADQVDRPDLRGGALGQAAQAWRNAGKRERADQLLNKAIELRPNDTELLIDRAVVAASDKRLPDAIADLNRAITIAPKRDDALVLRASAKRALNDLAGARADADAAVAANPRNGEALLERGIIRLKQGDGPGAAEDWRQAQTTAPGTPAAQMAEINLKRMTAP